MLLITVQYSHCLLLTMVGINVYQIITWPILVLADSSGRTV